MTITPRGSLACKHVAAASTVATPALAFERSVAQVGVTLLLTICRFGNSAAVHINAVQSVACFLL